MSHQLLVLNYDEQALFNEGDIRELLSSIPGVHGITEVPPKGSLVRGDFEFQNDQTTVELSDDLKRISLTGTGVAALKLALEIKNRMRTPLRAFDTSYSFDIALDSVCDLKELQTKIMDEEDV